VALDPELESLRSQIDQVDERILELLGQRVELVLRVGELKRTTGAAVYDPERERLVLEGLMRRAAPPLDAETVRRIFERLIDESRRLEIAHIAATPSSDG
jgi:chorismate mutase-like protein